MKPTIRAATELDVPFIVSSFLKSYRNTVLCSKIHKKVYYDHMHAPIENLVLSCNVAVACDPDNEDHIWGYVLFDKINDDVYLHYVYVKQAYRKQGLGKKLYEAIPEVPVFHTFVTDVGMGMAKKCKLAYYPHHFLGASYEG